ncbi:MAG: TRAP transporter small permease subunit [Hyphomicrobiales bacterium]|nr:TRAP transporter small permease subunit [Hyphomicrobiales bacterium]
MSGALKRIDDAIGRLTTLASNALLVLIVLVVLYNVVMRYVFEAPPFWTDRIGVFANIGMILFGLSLTVRDRELIAMQALYEKISPLFALALDATWNALILIFSIIFAWYGLEAAINMPGQYWDFQDFCIDLDLGDDGGQGIALTIAKSVETVVGMAVRPFCVDGAVPQKYLAMLMPISGLLLVIASLGVLIEDAKQLRAMRGRGAVRPDETAD